MWAILLRQANSLMVWILTAAAIVSFLMVDTFECYTVTAG
ncbi:cation-transporting P-type ATPase [Dyadobacter sp. 50-39]